MTPPLPSDLLRTRIEDRYADLAADYRREHGREPDRATQLRLAQAATLQTREGKEPGRTLDDQVADWTEQAAGIVGHNGVHRMLTSAVGGQQGSTSPWSDDVDRLARRMLATVSEQRATWTRWNLYAETERLLRPIRLERIACGQVSADGIELHDGNRAGIGDWVVTRTNLRGLTCHRGRDWVKNGDTWHVTHKTHDGTLTVRHLGHNGRVRLPAEYVADQVELAYATTVDCAQGTVDTAHPLVTEEMTREALYVASTRVRVRTTWYVATEDLLDPSCDHAPDPPRDVREVLGAVLRRVGAEESATQAIRSSLDDAESLPALVARYDHAPGLAAKDALAMMVDQTLPQSLGEFSRSLQHLY